MSEEPDMRDVDRGLSEIEMLETNLNVRQTAIHLSALEKAANESMREAAELRPSGSFMDALHATVAEETAKAMLESAHDTLEQILDESTRRRVDDLTDLYR